MTSLSVSGVVGGERGCGQEIFYLRFGDSFLLDHRQEELHFKLSLTHVLHCLRTVPTIVTAHIFCACQGSRARRERNAQHAGHADWFCLL